MGASQLNRTSGFCWRCKGVPGEGVNSSCNLGNAASATLPLMGSNISFCPAAAFRGFLPFDGSMFLGSLRPQGDGMTERKPP